MTVLFHAKALWYYSAAINYWWNYSKWNNHLVCCLRSHKDKKTPDNKATSYREKKRVRQPSLSSWQRAWLWHCWFCTVCIVFTPKTSQMVLLNPAPTNRVGSFCLYSIVKIRSILISAAFSRATQKNPCCLRAVKYCPFLGGWGCRDLWAAILFIARQVREG